MRSTDVPRRRSQNLRLDGSSLATPAEVVAWHGAIQAQEPRPAAWSLAQRASGLRSEDVDRAVADGEILRTHALRPTWHFVARDDARLVLGLTGPRVLKGLTSRYRDLDLDARTMARAQRAILKALSEGRHLTRAQLAEALRRSRIDTAGQRLPHMLMHCELDLAICSGARAGKEHTYAAFDDRVPPVKDLDPAEATRVLVERYLRSHGPASVHDIRWWASLKIADIRTALEELGPVLESATIGGDELWWVGETEGRRDRAAVRLLETYDEFVVGYSRTRFLGDPHAEWSMEAWRGRSRLRNVVARSGLILGVWRRAVSGKSLTVEVRTPRPLSASSLSSLRSESQRLGRFYGVDAALDLLPLG